LIDAQTSSIHGVFEAKQERAVQAMKGGAATRIPRAARPSGIVEALQHWWHAADSEQRYLEAVTDLADLERRMRLVERGSGGPVFVTFNH
jgi:hypothetical protein